MYHTYTAHVIYVYLFPDDLNLSLFWWVGSDRQSERIIIDS